MLNRNDSTVTSHTGNIHEICKTQKEFEHPR